jgi:hypothetical protein
VKPSFHKRLQQLEEVRAGEVAVDRRREEKEEYRLATEQLYARIDAYIEEHGIPEEPPEGLAKAVENLRRQLTDRAEGRS